MVATVGSMRVAFDADLRRYEAGLRRGERATAATAGKMNRNVASTQTAIGRLNTSAATLAGTLSRTLAPVIGGLGLMQLGRQSRRVISDLSDLAKQIDRVGLSAEVFQELQFGFELAGVAQSDFNTGMERFNRVVGQAAMGTGRFLDILEANNVAIRDQNGDMRSTESLLKNYADLIRDAGSAQERMALAQEAFGRGGADFVNALANGAAGFDDMADAADRAGGTIREEVLREAERIDDEFAELWRRFEIRAKEAVVVVAAELRKLDKLAEQVIRAIPAVGLAERLFGSGEEGGIEATTEELERLERRLGTLQDAAERNVELGIETDEVDANIARVEQQIAVLQQRLRNLNDEAARGYTAATPGDPNALAGQGTGPRRPTRMVEDDDDDDSGGGGGRDSAARRAIREAEAVERVIGGLEHELALMDMTETERAQANALRSAGAAATDDQRAQIEDLVAAIEREREANEQLAYQQDVVREAAFGVKDALSDGKLEWEELGDVALRVLERITDKLLDDVLNAIFEVNNASGGLGGGALFGELSTLNLLKG